MSKKQDKRLDWDHFWFLLAALYSTRGTCDRLRAACLIVKDKRLVGAGYNGSPFGLDHCDDVGHLLINNHCERTIHSEENAVINTERRNVVGAIAYITAIPCIRCARILINSGVSKVNYINVYNNSRGNKYLKMLSEKSGVKFIKHKLDLNKLFDEALERLGEAGGALNKNT